jgi:hypothetical protein
MGERSISPPFFTSILDGGESLVSRPCHFTPQYPLDRRLMDPSFGIDAVKDTKILLCRESNPSSPAHSYIDSAILHPLYKMTE